MRQRLFITSTGTGIGKTFITAALTRQAKALGKSVAAYKPVITGFDPSRAHDSDSVILLDALRLPPTQENIARISPWRFKEPMAPSLAAKMEKRTLDFDAVAAFSRKVIDAADDLVLIEGAGGMMAPIDQKHTMRDWIEALEVEAVLVTGSYLGSLSHTLTALEALKQREIPIFTVIVNESIDSPVSLQATVDELSGWSRLPIVPVKRRAANDSGNDISELRALIS